MNYCYLLTAVAAWLFVSRGIGSTTIPNNIEWESQPNIKSSLSDLQSSVNLLTASRTMTVILDRFTSMTSPSGTESHKPSPEEWKSLFGALKTELLHGLQTRAYCVACYVFLSLAKLFAAFPGFKELLYAFLPHLCNWLEHFGLEICKGYVDVGFEDFFYVLRHFPYNVSTMCANFMGFGCLGQNDDFWTVKFPNKPKPPLNPATPPKDGSPTLTVLHLTDLHLDRFYVEGSPTDCGLHVCCRKDSPRTKKSTPAGPWGGVMCDLPIRTMLSLLDHLNSTLKPDFIIFTGDLPPHDEWQQSQEENRYLIDYFAETLKKYFPEHVFFAVGNHEAVPIDAFPPESVKGIKSNDWLYEKLWSTWSRWLPESTHTTIKKGAFYSAPAKKGLRVISINTNFGKLGNWLLYVNFTDPMDQLQWFVDELQKAEDVGEKVLLITHVPPGDKNQLPVWSSNFYNIINRYENTIIGILCGHTHWDHFEVFYDESSGHRPTRVTYVTPSITPWDNLNPAYRVFTLDGEYEGSSFEILDHTTYYADIVEGNKNNNSLEWKKLYSAKDLYGLESLQASEWDKLITRMKDSPELFAKFYRMFSSASSSFPPSDEWAKQDILCALKQGKPHDFNMCNV